MILLVFLLALFAAPAIAQTPNVPPTVVAVPTPIATPRPLPKLKPALPTPPAPEMFPFALPPFDSSQTPTDVSWMNDLPAGARGFVSTQGEHFVDGQGRVLRLWGVNINFAGAFPSKEDAPKIAARLAKFGFNAVRLHHYEGYAGQNGIWKAVAIGSSKPKIPREFDPDQLDRLDFFISELIKHGIYIDLNLHVGRKTTDSEGVQYASTLPEKDKGIDYFDPQLVRLQRDFSRAILTHVNPYTGRALKDEPGVCAIEMTNEDSLLGMWLEGSLSMPNNYAYALNDKWMMWLKARYKTDAAFKRAWTEIDAPLQGSDILAFPLPTGIANPDAPDARKAVSLNELAHLNLALVSGAQGLTSIDPIGGPSVDGFVRPGLTANLQTSGSVTWAFQLNRDGLDLQEGQVYTLSFWARADSPRRISVNLWQDREPHRFEGFTGYADLTVNWEQYSFVFRPVNPDPQHSRISWNFGKDTGTIQLGETNLHVGGKIALPETWSLTHGVPNLEWKSTPISRARRDFAEFLGGVESDSVSQMRDYLRKNLGVKVPIWNTQAQFGGWGGLAREGDLSDAIDVHAYWKHPSFGGAAWSNTDWKIGNASMTASAANDPLSAFAFYRVPNKPFVMSEWNSGQPNDFGAETLLMAASYAAWQDWAGVFLFDYHSNGSYNRNFFDGFFSIDSQPAKMVTAPAAALIFRRPPAIEYSKAPSLSTSLVASNSAIKPLIPSATSNASGNALSNAAPKTGAVTTQSAAEKSALNASVLPVSSGLLPSQKSDPNARQETVTNLLPGDALPATDNVTLTLPRDLTWDETASFSDGPTASAIIRSWRDAGGVRSVPLQGRLYAQLGDGLFARATRTTAPALGDSPMLVGDTRQMMWDSKKDVFCLDTPRSKVAVGFLGARFTQVGEWQIVMPQTQNNWASLSLTSLDGKEIASSKSLLLTAVGKAENIGMGWNADRSSVGNQWGTGPTQIEGILAYVRLMTDLKNPRVYSLDETGARHFLIPSRLRNGVLSFTLSPSWKTAWYQIEG